MAKFRARALPHARKRGRPYKEKPKPLDPILVFAVTETVTAIPEALIRMPPIVAMNLSDEDRIGRTRTILCYCLALFSKLTTRQIAAMLPISQQAVAKNIQKVQAWFDEGDPKFASSRKGKELVDEIVWCLKLSDATWVKLKDIGTQAPEYHACMPCYFKVKFNIEKNNLIFGSPTHS